MGIMTDLLIKIDPEIIVGRDTISRVGTISRVTGQKTLIIAEGPAPDNRGNAERLCAILRDSGVESIVFDEIPAHATAAAAVPAAELARGARCTGIIGLGGPHTQSIARLSAMIAPSGLEVPALLDGAEPGDAFLPYIAAPMAGQDPLLFTHYLIAVDPRDRSVKTVKTPRGLCAAVFIDSGLGGPFTGNTATALALDGFSAAAEAYCSGKAHFLSDALLEQAFCLHIKSLDLLQSDESAAAEALSQGALLTALGTAISAPGIGLALAYALSGRFPVEKSWCAAALLPPLLERLAAARPERLAKIAALIGEAPTGSPAAEAAPLVLTALRRRMELLGFSPRLGECGQSMDRMAPVAEAARALGFTAFSPWTVSEEETYGLLKAAF
jgi:alcohol dehydrogenase